MTKEFKNMEVEVTRIGERGQVVIPQSIRDKMPAPKGTLFSVILVDKDVLVMKRFDKIKILKEFKDLRTSIKKRLKDEDIIKEIKEARKI